MTMSDLTDFKLLSFDVYGTLVDWERGLVAALQPALQASNKNDLDPKHIIRTFNSLEGTEQVEKPTQRYSDSLTTVYPHLCKELGLKEPTYEEAINFGQSVGHWPAFLDTVEALKRLSKVYKLVVLSNVDNESFKLGNETGLEGFKFDAIYTAEDIGSYKPDRKNFEYMLKHVKEEFGVEKHEVLQTAQSQFHDHHVAKDMGIKSAWIYRPEAILGRRDNPVFNWKFDTLKDMAEWVFE